MNTTTNEKRSNLVPIIMMVILFGMISFVTNLAAPMGQVLKEQFGVSNFQGLLVRMYNPVCFPSTIFSKASKSKPDLLLVFFTFIFFRCINKR
jgi:hypothetical protein